MKNFKTIAIALLVAFSATTINAQTKKVDVSKSKINWVGKKVTGRHEGTVNLKDGTLVFKGKKLTGGSFTIDMTSINTTDLKAGQGKEKLDGHLKADDFFGTENFPTSTLIFDSVIDNGNNIYAVKANLIIKGINKPIFFNLLVNNSKATTSFKVDRTKYNIKYGSGSFFDSLGDKAISDEFELAVELFF